MEYAAKYFEHLCKGDEECGGIVLRQWPAGTRRLRRVAVEVLPGKLKLFDALADAENWAAKSGDTVKFSE